MRPLSLFLVLALARAFATAGAAAPEWARFVAFAWQDVAVVLAYSVVDRCVRRGPLGWLLYGLCAGFACLSLAVVQVLSTPLTASMLRATDIAIADSIRHYLTPGGLLLPAIVGVVACVLPWALRRVRLGRGVAVGLLLVGCVSLVLGPAITGRVTADRHSNGLLALLGSYLPRVGGWSSTDAVDWRQPIAGSAVPAADLGGLRGTARGKNVLLVVLESVGARYLRPYGAPEDPMPNLTRLSRRSLLFTDAYAVYPESIKGLVALQQSVHPAIDTHPADYRALGVPALPAVLASAGYRTGLFHSGRFDYLGMRAVVEGAGYDTALDAAGIGGDRESSFGVEETATVARALDWIDAGGAAAGPFFLAYMPVAGHHPYDAPGVGPFPPDDVLGAYRNALHFADAAIGQLLAGLCARGLLADTVVVVVGDHGQAFGQHDGNFGHTFHLFDENVHVPFFITPTGPHEGRRVETVASHVDVAPTVLDLVGVAIPAGYEGASLLRPGPPRMALLFTDYASAYVGVRDGPYKFIHQLESGASWLFDVDRDPLEARSIAASHPDRISRYKNHLQRWSRSQRARIQHRR